MAEDCKCNEVTENVTGGQVNFRSVGNISVDNNIFIRVCVLIVMHFFMKVFLGFLETGKTDNYMI